MLGKKEEKIIIPIFMKLNNFNKGLETGLSITKTRFLEGISGFKPLKIEVGPYLDKLLVTYENLDDISAHLHAYYTLNSTTNPSKFPQFTLTKTSFSSNQPPKLAHFTSKDSTISVLTPTPETKILKISSLQPFHSKS